MGGWFHVIINLQYVILDKGNVFFPIGGVENTSFDTFPWDRWWGSRIMDIWWSRGRLFFKEDFSWPLPTDDREPLGTMEGLPGNVRGREENGFV